jgi:hypothetical protein
VIGWFKDGQPVTRNRDFRFRVSGDGEELDDGGKTSGSVAAPINSGTSVGDFAVGGSSSLTISDAHVHDSGNYTCRAYNRIDSATASARLIVKGAFQWVPCQLSSSC